MITFTRIEILGNSDLILAREQATVGDRTKENTASEASRGETVPRFRAEKRKKHARTLREGWAPKGHQKFQKWRQFQFSYFQQFTMLPQISR